MINGPTHHSPLPPATATPLYGPQASDSAQAASAPADTKRPTNAPEQDHETQSEQEQTSRELRQLQARDREVRDHEQAHIAAGGAHVRGSAQYTYEKGPDGRLYAVGGEVPIDTSPVAGNPQATLAKAETIQRAALAPSEPSGQDQNVAASARQMAAQARIDIARLRTQDNTEQNTAASPQTEAPAASANSTLAAEPDPLLDTVI